MFSSLRFVILAALLSVAVLSHSSQAVKFGTPYGADGRWAGHVGKAKVKWYHHWQSDPVPQMPKDVEYVPMFWGPKYNSLWQQRKKWIHKHNPKFILSLNEPDVKGQADVSPAQAAKLHMRELEPLRKKGHKVSSPQIVWNTKWMDEFLSHIRKQGGDVDFIAAHYYGSWKDVGRFQKWIKQLRSKYHKSVWITEYGVTASSHGSAGQIKSFQRKVNAWMNTKKYVKRAAWLGCFAVNHPPDSFASRQNALFSSGGSLRSIGYQYVYGGSKGKRDESVDEDDEDDEDVEDEHVAPVARATPGSTRHALQHHRRIIGLQQAADIQRRNETVDPTTINGFPATPEEIQEYLETLKNENDDEKDVDFEGEPVDCDETCRLRDGETGDVELDDDDKLHH